MSQVTMDPMSFFTKFYDGYKAAVFDNALEYNNFTIKLGMQGRSFLTKIVKGKRAGKKQRSFIVMLVEEAEKQDGDRD